MSTFAVAVRTGRSTQGRVVWRSQWVEMPRAATQGGLVAEAVH
jgi:hypothetical protein